MSTLADKLPKSLSTNSINLIKLNRVLPPMVSVILIIACSYTLSQITWSLIPGDDEQAAAPARPGAKTRQPVKNYSSISDAHLFGIFQQDTAPAAKTDAPETRLNLVLKGVLASTPMEYGNAIISMGKNGKEDTYGVGDKVSSATVKEIHADRVILERSGRLETLRMPKDFNDNLIKSAPGSMRRSSTAATPGAVLSNIRKIFLKTRHHLENTPSQFPIMKTVDYGVIVCNPRGIAHCLIAWV